MNYCFLNCSYMSIRHLMIHPERCCAFEDRIVPSSVKKKRQTPFQIITLNSHLFNQRLTDELPIGKSVDCDVTDCNSGFIEGCWGTTNCLVLPSEQTCFGVFCVALCCCIWSVLIPWQLDWIWWQLGASDALCVSSVIGNVWFSCFRSRKPEHQSVCVQATSQTIKTFFFSRCKK